MMPCIYVHLPSIAGDFKAWFPYRRDIVKYWMQLNHSLLTETSVALRGQSKKRSHIVVSIRVASPILSRVLEIFQAQLGQEIWKEWLI